MLSDVSTGLVIAMPPSLACNDISLRSVSLESGRSINARYIRGSSYYMGPI